MYLFTVVISLAVQAAAAYTIPTGLPTKYACEGDNGHDTSLTIRTARATPTGGVYKRDLDSGIAKTTVGHHIPLMPPFDQPCATKTVTHTTTKTEPLTDSSDSTTTTTITQTRTTMLFIKGNSGGNLNTTNTNNATLNGTVPHNTRPKNLKVSTDSKCGAKVKQTCIGNSEGHCCSKYGYCGDTDAHCGAGCQSGFGVCGAEGLSTALKSIKSLAPLLDRVLVQRIKAQTQTAGGIFLPESSVKELNEARVLAVGPGGLDKEGKTVKPSVQAGDKVLIPQYGGSPVKVGEEEYALFRDYELLAKIN
ncbi:hypothetical protein V494_07053, partial [Pseudogymnoascus sp. VKM F-4513 (FW-928)]